MAQAALEKGTGYLLSFLFFFFFKEIPFETGCSSKLLFSILHTSTFFFFSLKNMYRRSCHHTKRHTKAAALTPGGAVGRQRGPR